jgi:hypothetical protein
MGDVTFRVSCTKFQSVKNLDNLAENKDTDSDSGAASASAAAGGAAGGGGAIGSNSNSAFQPYTDADGNACVHRFHTDVIPTQWATGGTLNADFHMLAVLVPHPRSFPGIMDILSSGEAGDDEDDIANATRVVLWFDREKSGAATTAASSRA